MNGLIIKKEWADMILSGEKTIEIRGSYTTIRGRIAIIISGTKKIWGTAYLSKVYEFDKKMYEELKNEHKVNLKYENIGYKNPHGWALEKAIKFKEPIPYNHKKGCVIWVKLPDDILKG